MLEIGNGGMSADEYRTQMSLWAILAAPLLAGNDLSKMDETTKSILMNKEVIAVDQDSLGVQGFRLGPPQIWVRPLSGGAKALAIFNYVTDDVPQPVTVAVQGPGLRRSGPCTRSVGAQGPRRTARFVYRDSAQGRRGDAAAVAVRGATGALRSYPRLHGRARKPRYVLIGDITRHNLNLALCNSVAFLRDLIKDQGNRLVGSWRLNSWQGRLPTLEQRPGFTTIHAGGGMVEEF